MRNYRKSCIICNSGEALCELFHRETSLSRRNHHIFQSYISRAFDNSNFIEANERKRADAKRQIEIPLNAEMTESDLFKVIKNRKSSRTFKDESVSFKTLSTLLHYSYGRSSSGFYTVPSAGGNFPLKLIIIINKVDGLVPGLYEYVHANGSLVPLNLDPQVISYEKVTHSITLCQKAAFSIHFLGSLKLMCYKYQDRGYRFINIECGHIAQNLSLVSEALSLGSVCSGGFLDGEFIGYLEQNTNQSFLNYVYLYEMYFGICES